MSTFMANMLNLSLILIIFFSLFHQNGAVKCWDCSSDTDQNCADPFNKSTLLVTDCSRISDTQQQCRKTAQKVGEHWRFIRGCVMDDENRVSDAIEYICDYDGCNSAAVHVPILSMMLIASFFTTINLFSTDIFI